MNSHPKQHPSRCLSDYTNQIHYTKSDLHERRCSFKGEHQSVHHIIHMTHALPFGYPCSEAMSVHARLVKLNLSIPHVQIWLAPVVCTRRVYHTRSSRDASKRRVFATVHTKDEHFIILIFSERDHLIVLPRDLSNIRYIKKGLTSHAIHYVIWYGLSTCAFDLHLQSTGMISIITSEASRSMAPLHGCPSLIATITTTWIKLLHDEFDTQVIKYKNNH